MTLIDKLSEISKNEEQITISSIGPIASGKSFFLSALHNELGYHTKGIKIEKLKMNDVFFESRILKRNEEYKKSKELLEKVISRPEKGIRRLSGTSEPDKLKVFVYIEDKVIPIDFYAPGGHDAAVKLDKQPDGVFYFIDSNFASFSNLLKEERLNLLGEQINYKEKQKYFFQYVKKDPWGIKDKKDKKGVGFGLPLSINKPAWLLEKYNCEILGDIVNSIYKSKKELQIILENKIPLEMIIKKDNKSKYNFNNNGISITKEFLIKEINESIKNLTKKYIQYLELHPKRLIEDLRIYIPPKEFILIDQKNSMNIIDSANHKRKNVRNTFYNLIKKVLENKGYRASDLKLINFVESKDPRTIYYKEILKAKD